MRAADASLVPLDAQPAPRKFVPRKALRLLRCGRAVILAAAGESRRLVTEARAGITVRPRTPMRWHMPFDAYRGIRHSVHVPGKRACVRDALPARERQLDRLVKILRLAALSATETQSARLE
jgi:hypothetical protein